MKLALIYSVWDDFDLLECSLRTMEPLADGVIIVASEYSNYGEYSPIPEKWRSRVCIWNPRQDQAMTSETAKRNIGLELARKAGFTHFLTMDADEVYDPEEFNRAKHKGNQVCPCVVYFAKPTLTIGRDVTLVPFIHEITPGLQHTFNRKYPYAWINGQIRIDPTRSMNINSGVNYTEEVTMHHASWLRKDYDKKIRNSTAKFNLEKSTILKDLENASPGYYCQFYKKTLIKCDNVFGFPDFKQTQFHIS